MKFVILGLTILYAIASTNAEFRPRDELPPRTSGPTFPYPEPIRLKRSPEPQGSLVIHGTKPMSGPDRRPSLDVNYNRNIFDNGRTSVNGYGGLNVRPGMGAQPHAGANFEHKLGKHGFISGNAQGQRLPGGRIEPSFHVGTGLRFRREVEETHDEIDNVEEVRVRRAADPQGSVVLRGEKPLGGPDRRPSFDLDYNQRIHDGRFNANAYGGVNIRPGQSAQPHVGLNFERQFGKDGFISGFGQAQRGQGGRIDPSFGVRGGFRFRRDAEEQEFEEQE